MECFSCIACSQLATVDESVLLNCDLTLYGPTSHQIDLQEAGLVDVKLPLGFRFQHIRDRSSCRLKFNFSMID